MADRYEEIARKIREAHFLNISLATAAGRKGDLQEACRLGEQAIASALRDQDTWYELDDPEHPAPRDGTRILIWLKNPIPNDRDDLRKWDGIPFVARHPGIAHDGFDVGWTFAAPVGHGGFPDEWIAGWRPMPLPPSPGRNWK